MTARDNDAGLEAQALQLSEELTIAVSGELHQQLAARLEQGGDIRLDAGAVTRVDAAIIQLLYQVQRVLVETGCRLEWAGVSPAFARSVALLGMSTHLQMPADA